MSRSVKLSGPIVLDARLVGQLTRRSIAGQNRRGREAHHRPLRPAEVPSGEIAPAQAMNPLFDRRPAVVAVGGPNGAGKTTFCRVHLAPAGLRYVGPDALAKALRIDACAAARPADAVRRQSVRQRESSVFETVFSDPGGNELEFLKAAAREGCTVSLCFIGISGLKVSGERVAMRVSQRGHDVPADKLAARYPRCIANLEKAIRQLPHVLAYDNEDPSMPFRHVAAFEEGKAAFRAAALPEFLARSTPRATR